MNTTSTTAYASMLEFHEEGKLKLASALGVVVVSLFLFSRLSSKSSAPLPPGPRGWPIVGAMFEMPTVWPWHWLHKLHDQHGPLVSFKVMGQPIVSIGSYEVAKEILNKKASVTSGRPPNYVWDTIVYRNRAIGFQSDTPAMHTGRKIIMQQPMFADVRKGRTEAVQQFEAAHTLMRLLENPDKYRDELQRFTTSEATVPLFGVHMETPSEPFVDRLRVALDSIFLWAAPYCSMINAAPALDKFIPNACAPWRKAAWDFTNYYTSVGEDAVNLAKETNRQGINSWVSDVLNGPAQKQIEKTNSLTTEIQALELVQAASETTWTVLLRFMTAWTLYPERMRPAQAEIDALCGLDRFPAFDDRPNLPQMEALAREVMRWRPAIPLGLEHTTTEDLHINVEGKTYMIPKGASLWGNLWEMDALRKGIPNPEEFNPSNQLEANGNLKPFAGSHNTFGWGRRTCIGQPFAERGLYTMISHMLWAFNCTPGPDGPPDVNNISFGITSVPQPFKVNLTPRSEAHVEAAKREWDCMEKDLARLSQL